MTILEVKTEQRGAATHVLLSGELDLSSADELETALQRAEGEQPSLLVLDLTRLKFLDSTGLRIVVSADQRARQAGRRVVVVKGPETVNRVFSITKLDERLELVDDATDVSAP